MSVPVPHNYDESIAVTGDKYSPRTETIIVDPRDAGVIQETVQLLQTKLMTNGESVLDVAKRLIGPMSLEHAIKVLNHHKYLGFSDWGVFAVEEIPVMPARFARAPRAVNFDWKYNLRTFAAIAIAEKLQRDNA